MNRGAKLLGGLIMKEMSKTADYKTVDNISFGKIQSGMGLKIDGLNYTIPRSDYLVCRSCYEYITVGSRVLVGITYNGEPVVIDILV